MGLRIKGHYSVFFFVAISLCQSQSFRDVVEKDVLDGSESIMGQHSVSPMSGIPLVLNYS